MLSFLLFQVFTSQAYYLGLELDEVIRVNLNLVSFADRRYFSFEGLEVLSKNPESSVFASLSLIGRNLNSGQNCSEKFPPNNLTCTAQKDLLYNLQSSSQSFAAAEVQAMILENIKNSLRPKTNFKGSVFAVPGFFTQAQRIYLKTLAEGSKLKPLAFVNQDLLTSAVLALDRLDDKEKYALAFTAKSDHISASLLKFSSASVNKGKVTEKKIESLKLVRSEYNFEFGWKSVENHLAEVLVQEVTSKCPGGSSAKINLAKVKEKIRKLIEKVQAGVEVVVKFEDLADGCKESLEVNKTLIENFIELNQDEVLKPVLKLIRSDLAVSSLVLSHQSEQFFEKVLSTVIKTRSSSSNHAVAVGAALIATNYSSEVHLRPLWVGQAFQFNSQVLITSRPSGKVRTKSLFDQDSLLGTTKKFGFSSQEDLSLEVLVDYGAGFVKVSEYSLNELESFSAKYNQPTFVVLEFSLDDFGILLLSSAEAKVEVEVEFEREVKKEEKPKQDVQNDSLPLNETHESPETEVQDVGLNETQLKTSQENPDQTLNNEENQTPKFEKVLKKKTIKTPLSVIQVFTEKNELSALNSSQISRLSQLSSSESLSSDLRSSKSSLLSLYSSESGFLNSSEINSYLSAEDKSWLSSFPSSVQQASSFSSLRSLRKKLEFLISSLKQRKADLSSLESLKIYTASSFDSLLKELKDLARSKPWIPSEEVESLSREISETKTWLLDLSEKELSPELSNIEFNSGRVQGKLNRLSYKMQVLSKSKQKKTDL